jgi:cobalt-zinc-cadmium efflux system outer membrane protein
MRRHHFPRYFLVPLLWLWVGLPSCAHVKEFQSGTERPNAENGERRTQSDDDSRPLLAGSEVANQDSQPGIVQTVFNDQLAATPAEFLREPIGDDISVFDVSPSAALPGSDGMTIERLEQLAVEHNPTLKQAVAVVDKARGIRRQVGSYPNPVIGYLGDEMGDDGTAGKQGGVISQIFVTGGKLHRNRAVAGHDVQALSWELEAQRYRVLTDVRLQFYKTLGAQRRVSLAGELVKIAEAGVKAANEFLEAELGTRPHVLQAEVQLNEIRIIQHNAQFDYEAAWRQLSGLIGLPDMKPAPLLGELEGEPIEHNWEETLERLVADSPELQAAYARVNRAFAMVGRQQAQSIPNLLIEFGVAHDYASGDSLTSVQLGVPLPLFNRNQGNIDVATAEYRRTVEDARRLELSLRVRLAEAFRNFNTAQKQVERYRQDIVPKSKENFDLTNEGYTEGEYDFLRVLIARRSYFESQLAYGRSLVALRKADVVISGLLLTGGLNDVPDVSWGAHGMGSRGQALSGQ